MAAKADKCCRLKEELIFDNEMDEPPWVPFDEAVGMVSEEARRAILRVLSKRQGETVPFGKLRDLVAGFRGGRSLAPSSLSTYLKDFERLGLVTRSGEGAYKIRSEGRKFLQMYDDTRAFLTDLFSQTMREKQAQLERGYRSEAHSAASQTDG